ncbi:hypothetical protein HaLaN_02829, partial [Haematococcus lacustris]
MSGQDGAHNNSTTTERANVDPHLTNVLKHYATSVDNNPDKWTELAKCLINNLPSVTSQVRCILHTSLPTCNTCMLSCLTVLAMASQAFNGLKELEKAYVDLEQTKVQLKQRKDEHKMLQNRLKEAIGNTTALQAEVVKAQQQVAELQAELKKREAQCANLEAQLKGMVVSDEETRLRARCKELEEEIEALRRQPAESRSLQQVSTPPPARAVAEGDNIAGPSGIQQVDQARSALKPTRLSFEEPIGNAQVTPKA